MEEAIARGLLPRYDPDAPLVMDMRRMPPVVAEVGRWKAFGERGLRWRLGARGGAGYGWGQCRVARKAGRMLVGDLRHGWLGYLRGMRQGRLAMRRLAMPAVLTAS